MRGAASVSAFYALLAATGSLAATAGTLGALHAPGWLYAGAWLVAVAAGSCTFLVTYRAATAP